MKRTIKNLSKEISISRQFLLIDLRAYFNNDGISFDLLKCDGDFDGKGGTYPAEELPPSNTLIHVDDIPFFFPSKENGDVNNFVLSGQSVPVESNLYESLYVLGAVEGLNGEIYEEELTVSYESGECEPIYLGLSNWLLAPRYREKIAFECSHLHFPDEGQETLFNKNTSDILAYDALLSKKYETSPFSDLKDSENNKRGIWKPRIFMQKVTLPAEKRIAALTFMDNLNFHIFAMTLSKKTES